MKLMVLDGNSIINRAFYGIRTLTAPDGTPTNGVYGFLAILQKLLEEERPDAVCVAFDLPAPTFRHEQFDGYKAQRKGMPDELAAQMPVLKEVLDAMGVRRYELSGYEADDLIGTICRAGSAGGWECIVVTGDKDSFQLISENVRVKHVKTRAGRTETIDYDTSRFIDEYGFEPPKMVDLKALMGDSSDNIPGVPGVGEKTALDLVRRFGTVDAIYENLAGHDIRDSLRQKLTAGEKNARMSWRLALIDSAAPIEFKPEQTTWDGSFRPELHGVLKRLGFSRFIEKWDVKPNEGRVTREDVDAAISVELDKISTEGFVAIEVSPDFRNFSLSDGKSVSSGVFLGGPDESDNPFLREIFSEQVKKASHNVKDLMRSSMEAGLDTRGWTFDTALAAYLLDPTENNYGLSRLAQKYLGCEHGGAQTIFKLSQELDGRLQEMGMRSLYYDIEFPLCRVLADMERAGFVIDRKALGEFGESLNESINTLQNSIWALSEGEFNINSPKQLGEVLFEKLMLPHGKKTKTGWSTGAEVLEALAGKHPIVTKILDYRQLSKLKSTYADGLLKVIEPDGRIRTSFQMTVTATGRLSSTEPNLQNIPVRTQLGGEIRKMFIAEPGSLLVDADYSQIELRLLAHISGDETMKRAFSNGEDIHSVTASQVFGVPLSGVTPLMRNRAKAVNFGIVYGISDFSLARDIGVTRSEARSYIDSYLEKYSGVREYMKNIVERAKKDGYVSTLFGRRRPVPELSSSNYNIRSFGERVALNMPVQGTAADIIKLAMVNIHGRLKREGLKSKLILQVHDELIAECPENEAQRAAEILAEEMLAAATLSVPLTAEAHIGKNWFEAK